MNKEKNHGFTALLPDSVQLIFCIVAFLIAVNPTFVEAKETQAQKPAATKAVKKTNKNQNSKKIAKKDSKKAAEDTQEPVHSLFPENETPEMLEKPAPQINDTNVSQQAVSPKVDELTTDAASEAASTPTNTTKKERGYRISAGPLLGVRTMKMQGNRNAYEHNAPFYMGGMVDGELRLHNFSSFNGELWLQADAGYGTTIGGFGHADLANLSTDMAFLSGQFLLKRNFGDDWDMQFGLGMQALSLTVEPNRTYTGHRYIGPQIGINARRWFDNHRLSLGTELYALPVLWVNQSSQTDNAQSFGFRAGAELGWSPGEGSWALRLRYRFQRYRSQFPLASEGSRGAISEDNQHLLILMLSY